MKRASASNACQNGGVWGSSVCAQPQWVCWKLARVRSTASSVHSLSRLRAMPEDGTPWLRAPGVCCKALSIKPCMSCGNICSRRDGLAAATPNDTRVSHVDVATEWLAARAMNGLMWVECSGWCQALQLLKHACHKGGWQATRRRGGKRGVCALGLCLAARCRKQDMGRSMQRQKQASTAAQQDGWWVNVTASLSIFWCDAIYAKRSEEDHERRCCCAAPWSALRQALDVTIYKHFSYSHQGRKHG